MGVQDGIERLNSSFYTPVLGPMFTLLAFALPFSLLFIETPLSGDETSAGFLSDAVNELRGQYSLGLMVILGTVAVGALYRQIRGTRLKRWLNYFDMLLEAQDQPNCAHRRAQPQTKRTSRRLQRGFSGPR